MFLPMLTFSGAVRVDADLLRSHAFRVRQALSDARIEMKDACAVMDIDQAQFCRQLSGDGHISYTRLMLLPNAFWQALALLIADDYGIPRTATKAGLLWLATRARRQLRMSAAPHSVERKSA